MSSLMLDEKYVAAIRTTLRNFKKVGQSKYNCSCPVCGDSKKDTKKARFYFFKYKNQLFTKCHNCEYSGSFKYFLKERYPTQYSNYLKELLGGTIKHEKKKEVNFKTKVDLSKINLYKDLIKISSLDVDHPARIYLAKRKLPIDDLYWSDAFMAFGNSIKKDAFGSTEYDEGRIVIPYKDAEGETFMFQGRSLKPNSKRKYLFVKLAEKPKIYGMDKLDTSKPVMVFEGVFDAFFVQNSIATGDANYVKAYNTFKNSVAVPDTDTRNEHVLKYIETAIDAGMSVCLLPKVKGCKDINELVIEKDLTSDQIEKLISDHTYSGLRAKLEFKKWRDIK